MVGAVAVHLTIQIDPETLLPASVGAVAGQTGSDVDVVADHFAQLITGLMARGVAVEDLTELLRPASRTDGMAALAPAMLEEVVAAAAHVQAVAAELRGAS